MWTCPRCGEEVDDGFEVCWWCGTSIDGVPDPHFLDEGRVGPAAEHEGLAGPVEGRLQPLVTVATFLYPYQAHAPRARLEAAGLRVSLADELTIAMDWLLANAVGGIKVQVPAADAERARELLASLPGRAAAPPAGAEEEP
jgi:hypothetical protein